MNDLDRHVEAVARAHQTLLARIDGIDDATARRASLLPGWSVGHVLTHIARNADGLMALLEGAARGAVVDMYPDASRRDAAIEDGAGRTAAELVADVRSSAWALERAWATLDAPAWEGSGRTLRGEIPITTVPFVRLREVSVHHVDLGLGYGFDDLPAGYVDEELTRLTAVWLATRGQGRLALPEAALVAPARLRLAWLLGRGAIDGVAEPGAYP